MSGSGWTIQDALLVATVNGWAQTGAPVASALKKPIARFKKMDVSTLVRRMQLSYLALHASTVDTALCLLLIAHLAYQTLPEKGVAVLALGLSIYSLHRSAQGVFLVSSLG